MQRAASAPVMSLSRPTLRRGLSKTVRAQVPSLSRPTPRKNRARNAKAALQSVWKAVQLVHKFAGSVPCAAARTPASTAPHPHCRGNTRSNPAPSSTRHQGTRGNPLLISGPRPLTQPRPQPGTLTSAEREQVLLTLPRLTSGNAAVPTRVSPPQNGCNHSKDGQAETRRKQHLVWELPALKPTAEMAKDATRCRQLRRAPALPKVPAQETHSRTPGQETIRKLHSEARAARHAGCKDVGTRQDSINCDLTEPLKKNIENTSSCKRDKGDLRRALCHAQRHCAVCAAALASTPRTFSPDAWKISCFMPSLATMLVAALPQLPWRASSKATHLHMQASKTAQRKKQPVNEARQCNRIGLGLAIKERSQLGRQLTDLYVAVSKKVSIAQVADAHTCLQTVVWTDV